MPGVMDLLWPRLRGLVNRWTRASGPEKLTMSLFGAFGLLVWAGISALFIYAIQQFHSIELIGPLVLRKLLEILLLSLFTLLCFSNLVTALSVFYLSDDLELLRRFANEHSVQVFLQPGGYDTVAPLTEGPPLEYRLPPFDLTLQFLPTDFVQVNGALNLQMIERAVTLLAPTRADKVLDLFCGLGNFSLPLARTAGQVVGVEGEASLVARARANAERNGLGNTQFFTANLADEAVASASWAGKFDKVLLDPPRAGAKEVLPVVAKSGAATVLYISCHPGSLARDAGILVHEHGYKLRSAGVMDMFPHTAHVESIALFTR